MAFHVVDAFKNRALLVWVAWFSLLLGMPYIVHAGRYGAVFSSTYGFAALGVLAGLLAGFSLMRLVRVHDADPLNSGKGLRANDSSKLDVWRRLAVGGGVASTMCLLVFQIVAFADFEAVTFGVASEMPKAMRVFVYAVARISWLEPVLSFASAALCSAAASLVFFGMRSDNSSSGSLSTFVLASAFGFCSRLVWVGIAPVVYGETGFEVGIGCVFVTCIPFALVFAFLLCASSSSSSGCLFSSRLLIAAIGCSFGILAWTCLGRVAKVSEAFSVPAALAIVALAAVALFAHCVFSKRTTAVDGCTTSEEAAGKTDIRVSQLYSCGLSPRELQAALLLLEGKNSEESAGCMGVKAATVRSLLQRSYKKAGVSNGAEFIAAFGEESAAASNSKQASEAENGEEKRVVIARLLVAPTVFCFMATCFLPSGLSYVEWGIGREFVYGLGFGFLLAGFAAASVASGLICVKDGSHRLKPAWAIGLLLCASAAASSYFAGSLRLHLLFEEWQKAAAFGASFLFAALCVWVVCAAERNRGEQTPGIKRVEIYAWIVGVCVFAATRAVPGLLVPACFVLAVGLGVFAALVLRAVHFEPGGDPGAFGLESPLAMAALLIVAMTCGFLWEEAWRDQGYFSLMDFGGVFCAVAFFAAVVLLGQHRKHAAIANLAAGLLSLVLLAAGSTFALVALFTLVAAYMARRSVREKSLDWRGAGIVFSAFGMGFVAGDVLMNHIGDRLGFGYRAPLFDFLPEGDGARIVALCISSMLFSAAFLSVVTYCIYLRRFAARSRALESLSRSADERMVGYLVGRGLSDPHARIVADIAQGKTSGEIVRTRFYSRGSVNDARRKGYALLGVHSQEELAVFIQREMGL